MVFHRLKPDEVLKKLREGNQRFLRKIEQGVSTLGTEAPLQLITKNQNPFCASLGCADSRVPPEIIFDTGLGKLFSIRVAGNYASIPTIASLEYAVEVLDIPLLMVRGHSNCGAIAAVLELLVNGKPMPTPYLAQMAEDLIPPVKTLLDKTGAKKVDDALLAEAVVANIHHTVDTVLHRSTLITKAVRAGRVKIVGAHYHLDTGVVDFYEQAPSDKIARLEKSGIFLHQVTAEAPGEKPSRTNGTAVKKPAARLHRLEKRR